MRWSASLFIWLRWVVDSNWDNSQDAVDPALDSANFPTLPETGGTDRRTPIPEPTLTETITIVSMEKTPTEHEPDHLAGWQCLVVDTVGPITPTDISSGRISRNRGAGCCYPTADDDTPDLESTTEEDPDPKSELSSPWPTQSDMETGGDDVNSLFPTQSGRNALGSLPTKRPKPLSQEDFEKGWKKAQRKKQKKKKI